MKHVDDSSFPVKIQGAGLDSFEMQVKYLFLWTCDEKVCSLDFALCECALSKPCTLSSQIHGFWHVKDALMNLLSRDEVFPRSNLSLSFAGMTLDPLAELQGLKGLKPGAILRLVEGNSTIMFLTIINFPYLLSHLNITGCAFRSCRSMFSLWHSSLFPQSKKHADWVVWML